MKSRNIDRATQVFATLVLLACGAGLATAAPRNLPYEPHTVVRFHDLNLSNAKDVATLYVRIARAARWVCRDDTSVRYHTKESKCVDMAIEQAITDANRPALTALHRSKATRLAGG